MLFPQPTSTPPSHNTPTTTTSTSTSTPHHPPPTLFTSLPTYTPDASYNGYKKSTVFAQWQKHLQKQEYETALHWTAELDVSGWQDDIWTKIIIYASKHIHLHTPTLPTLLARNVAYYRHHVHTVGSATSKTPQHQPRNDLILRQNLCQVIGLLALSPKGPVYAMPKVDPQKVDEAALLVGTHVWLASHARPQKGDDAMVVRVLSTVCFHLESQNPHKAMYWLSVLVEYEKHQKKHFKRSLSMVARQPMLPDGARPTSSTASTKLTTSSLQHAVVEGKHARDWIWLLWQGLWEACRRYRRGAPCNKAFKALSYLFAYDYTLSKRNTRMPLVLHAMLLVRTDSADWTRSVYPTEQSAQMIATACANLGVMYRGIAEKRAEREQQLGLVAGGDSRLLQVVPHSGQRLSVSPNRHHVSVGGVDPARNSNAYDRGGTIVLHNTDPSTTTPPTPSPSQSQPPSSSSKASTKPTKSKGPVMSEDSAKKMAAMDAIDAMFLGL